MACLNRKPLGDRQMVCADLSVRLTERLPCLSKTNRAPEDGTPCWMTADVRERLRVDHDRACACGGLVIGVVVAVRSARRVLRRDRTCCLQTEAKLPALTRLQRHEVERDAAIRALKALNCSTPTKRFVIGERDHPRRRRHADDHLVHSALIKTRRHLCVDAHDLTDAYLAAVIGHAQAERSDPRRRAAPLLVAGADHLIHEGPFTAKRSAMSAVSLLSV